MRTGWILLLTGAALAAPEVVTPATPGYRITLWRDGDPARAEVIEGSPTGGAAHAQATVQVLTDRRPDGETAWNLEVKPAAGYGVYEIEFPILALSPIAGGADRLIVPYQHGSVIPDPAHQKDVLHGTRPRSKRTVWYGIYGSKYQGMQLVLFDGGRRGVMIWTPDPDLNMKDFEVSRGPTDGTLTASVHHFPIPSGRPGTGWRSPYPVLVTPYDQGWFDAVQRYRAWALRRPWCAAGPVVSRLRRGELPDWYARNALWLSCIDQTNIPILEALLKLFPTAEAGVFLTQWQHHAFDAKLPEYFPPKDEAGYRRVIALQRDRLHIYPYMNVSLCDVDFEPTRSRYASALCGEPPESLGWQRYFEYWGISRDKTEELRSALRRAWRGPVDEALLARIGSDWFGGYGYERARYQKELRQGWGGDEKIIDQVQVKNSFLPFCRAAALWQDTFVAMARRNLEEYGTDGQYLDQLAYGGLYVCWSDQHGHPPGFGPYPFTGTRRIAERILDGHPDKLLFGETVFEGYLDLVPDGYSISPAFYNEPVFPLFSAVYQGYGSLHEWPIFPGALSDPPSFHAALAAAVHLGFKIGSFSTMTTWMELLKPEHAAARGILTDLVDLKVRTTEVFQYGRRLADPVLDSPTLSVTWPHDKTGTRISTHQVPAVQASCWESLTAPRRRALIVSNSGPAPARVKVAADLPAGARLTDLAGVVLSYDPSAALDLPPLSWRALLSEPLEG